VTTTNHRQWINSPPDIVYRALLDPRAVQAWMVPDGMASQVHQFDPWVGGLFRVSLRDEAPTGSGRTSAHTRAYHGRFVELVATRRIVRTVEFETDDPAMRGEMRIVIDLAPVEGGTELTAVHEGLPIGVRLEDNDLSWRVSLAKLAAICEMDHDGPQRPPTHVGAYALCVVDGRILLARMAPGMVDGGQWTLPGGGVDWGEDPALAVLRELDEEAGLSGTIRGVAGIYSFAYWRSPARPRRPVHHMGIVFDVEPVLGDLRNEAEGSTDCCAWVPLDEADALPLVPLAAYGVGLAERRT